MNNINNQCEVVGWVLDGSAARVLVRNENEDRKQPTLSAEKAFEHFAVQTGSFRRNQIIDFVTRRALVCEAD